MKNIKKKLNKKGFTLIEMLVVVAIIAALIAIFVPNLMEAKTRSEAVASQAQAKASDTSAMVQSLLNASNTNAGD